MVVDEAILALAAKSHADPLAPFYRQVERRDHAPHDARPALRTQGDSSGRQAGLHAPPSSTASAGLRHAAARAGRHRQRLGVGLGGRATSVVTARKDFRANAVFSPLLTTDANGQGRVDREDARQPHAVPHRRARDRAAPATSARPRARSSRSARSTRAPSRRASSPRATRSRCRSWCRTSTRARARSTSRCAPRTSPAAGPPGKRVTVARRPARRGPLRLHDAAPRPGGDPDDRDLGRASPTRRTSSCRSTSRRRPSRSRPTASSTTRRSSSSSRCRPSIFPDVGGVEVELASTQLQSLTDAYWYLYAYPYECAEQRSARMLATAAMADILDAFETPGRPTRAGDRGATRARSARAREGPAARRRLGLLPAACERIRS